MLFYNFYILQPHTAIQTFVQWYIHACKQQAQQDGELIGDAGDGAVGAVGVGRCGGLAWAGLLCLSFLFSAGTAGKS